MNANGQPAAALCQVLREDVALLEAVPLAHRERATAECIAGVARIPRGHWSGQRTDIMRDGIGLLVLEGLLIRRVGISGSFGAELLGEGDLLRPWQGEDAEPTLPHTTGWRVLQPTRVAVLDRAVAHRLARYPELTGRLVARALERSRNLAMNMAIVHQYRIHVRLHMLLWHLADRWGYVRSDGIVLPIRLTHTVLADLVAAQRPTVTMALAQLAQDGLVHPLDRGWLLRGDPPGELLALQDLTPGTEPRIRRLDTAKNAEEVGFSRGRHRNGRVTPPSRAPRGVSGPPPARELHRLADQHVADPEG